MAGENIDNRGASIAQQIIVHGQVTIAGSTPRSSEAAEPEFEGPGRVPITPVPYFAGRVTDLKKLEQALHSHTTDCVVITGIGGIGKSSLARQFVATRTSESFPDGAAWLDATQLTRELDRVCRRFGWTEQRELTAEESVVFLARALHDRAFLIAIDNLNSGKVQEDQMPRPGGRCKTLVTTRERYLDTDLDAGRLELGGWSIEESTGYVRERCERLRGLSDDELAPLVEFAGGLPLGVKLLVSFLLKRPTLKPSDALATLRSQPMAVLEKYRGHNSGLISTFQSNYDDLDERARRVLQALAVCAPETQAEVVEAVSGVEEVEALLDALYGRSLVELDEGAKTPWKLHDVVRMFVQAQPGLEPFASAHLSWVEAHVRAHFNAFDYVAFGEGVEEATEALQRLVEARDFARAMLLYGPLVDHLRRVGSYPQAISLSQMLLSKLPAETGWQSACMSVLGDCYETLGDVEKAVDFHLRSLAIDTKLDNLEGQARALGSLGLSCRASGDVEKAIEFLQRALALNEKLDNLHGQAGDLGNIGACYRQLGSIETAIDFLQRALTLDVKLCRLENQAINLGNLGNCYLTSGDIQTAIDFLQRALTLEVKLGYLEGQALQLHNLGLCHEKLGDIQTAIAFLERSLAIAEDLGHFEAQSGALGNLGQCYRRLGNSEKLIELFQRGIALSEKFGRLDAQAQHLGELGACYLAMEDVENAITFLQRALTLDKQLENLRGQAVHLGNLGVCHMKLGDIQNAIDFFQQSKSLAEKSGHPKAQAAALVNLGLCHQRLGDKEKAVAFLGRFIALGKEGTEAKPGDS